MSYTLYNINETEHGPCGRYNHVRLKQWPSPGNERNLDAGDHWWYIHVYELHMIIMLVT